jgi:hypothetical protein
MRRASKGAPPRDAFTARERRLIERLSTPARVQDYLNALPYNTEPAGETLRSFRGVVRAGTAHCFEAAMFAAVVLEQHGYPPLVLSFESIDHLDHVLFVYKASGRWGSVARSRDPGLHGRLPHFRAPRDLALTYVDPYVDYTGGVTGYAVADLRDLGEYDWRFSRRYLWPAEQFLIDYPHRHIRTDRTHISRLRARYRAFRKANDDMKPVDYMGRQHWTPIPEGFRRAEGLPFAGPLARGGLVRLRDLRASVVDY